MLLEIFENAQNLSLFTECNCHKEGSVEGTTCDHFGQCECKTKFTGTKCQECSSGHYGFPLCDSELMLHYL